MLDGAPAPAHSVLGDKMKTKIVLAGCGLALMALAGCNKQAPSAPVTGASAPGGAKAADKDGATPDSRATAMLNDFAGAMMDPNISDPATQSKWVEKILRNYEPDKRAALQPKLAESVSKFGTMFTGGPVADGNTKVTIHGKIEDLKLEDANPTPDTAEVKVVSGTLHMDIEVKGATADKTSVDASKPVDLPLSALVHNKAAHLVKVNGVWYMVKDEEKQAEVASAPKTEDAPAAQPAAGGDAASTPSADAQPAKDGDSSSDAQTSKDEQPAKEGESSGN
jgi:hypothetical protein